MAFPSVLSDDVTFRDVLVAVDAAEREQERDRDDDEPDEPKRPAPTAQLSMRDWSALVPERGRELNFDRFPFQRDWYSDEVAEAKELVFMKSTQTGVSAYSWRWAARRADQFADTVIYIFPTDGHVSQFGQERIEPSIEDSDYLTSRIPPGFVRNQHQKRIGAGWAYLRGSTQTRTNRRSAGAQSVAAQALVFDEYDELEPRVRSQYERRISGAKQEGKEPRVVRIGVPSNDGYGISAEWDRSDQRVWHVVCPECRAEQPIGWETNVRWTNIGSDVVLRADHDDKTAEVEHAWRVCRDCEASLEGAPIAEGRWIATVPENRVIGFHATRLIVPGTDLEQIVTASRKTEIFEVEAFFNNDLGVPFTAAEAGLSREEVTALISMGSDLSSRYDGEFLVTGGLDVASARRMHLRISLHYEGKRLPLAVREIEEFEEVDALMDAFRIRLLIVDHMPERRAARALAARFPNRVMLARYEENPEKTPIQVNTNENIVTVQRTEAMDATIAAIRAGRHVLPRQAPESYVEHLIAPKRKNVETPKGVRRFYIKTGGHGDDFFHAETYDVVASDVAAMFNMASEAVETSQRMVTEQDHGIPGTRLSDDEYGGGGLLAGGY